MQVKMLIQLSVITTKSHVVIKPKLTKFDDHFNILSIAESKEIYVNDIVEVLAGCSKELHSIDKECSRSNHSVRFGRRCKRSYDNKVCH